MNVREAQKKCRAPKWPADIRAEKPFLFFLCRAVAHLVPASKATYRLFALFILGNRSVCGG